MIIWIIHVGTHGHKVVLMITALKTQDFLLDLHLA